MFLQRGKKNLFSGIYIFLYKRTVVTPFHLISLISAAHTCSGELPQGRKGPLLAATPRRLLSAVSPASCLALRQNTYYNLQSERQVPPPPWHQLVFRLQDAWSNDWKRL